MFFWNSLAFSMIQQRLIIWSLVLLAFLNPAWTSRSSQFTYCWSLTWRILSITFLACKMSATLLKMWGFPGGSSGKESACNVGDLGSILDLGRSPGEGNGYPLQYSGLENSMDCIVYAVAKSWTWLSNFHWHCLSLGPEWKLTFPFLWPLLSFPNLLAYWMQHFHSIIF